VKYYEKFEISKNEIDYLKGKGENLRKLIEIVGDVDREYIKDPFISLVNNIIFQQLSYKAAITIWNRFVELVGEITPQKVLSFSFEELRSCGISTTKISYIENIANAFLNKDIDLENIDQMTDEEVINSLIKIKGVGEWTSEMFLIFSLKRMNVLSYKDLGIRKGIN